MVAIHNIPATPPTPRQTHRKVVTAMMRIQDQVFIQALNVRMVFMDKGKTKMTKENNQGVSEDRSYGTFFYDTPRFGK